MSIESGSTISDLADRDDREIFARAQEGEISFVQAREMMLDVDASKYMVGDGWFDRYGRPPAELSHLYETSIEEGDK